MDQQEMTKPSRPHSPTLRVGDLVEFNTGDHAGVCGEITWVSLVSKWVVVMTQDGSYRTGTIEQINKV